MPIRITGFEWDEYNEEHIAEHSVTPDEVEACFFNPYILKRKKRGKRRYYLYGQTDGGRYLFIVCLAGLISVIYLSFAMA